MIEWKSVYDSCPPPGESLLFKVRGEKTARVGEYFASDEGFPRDGFEDTRAAEFYRAKRVSHWAPINLP